MNTMTHKGQIARIEFDDRDNIFVGRLLGIVDMVISAENRLTQAKFLCIDCGYENNADVVGAMNVLARGHRVAACGEDGSGSGRKTRTKPASVKQEPTEATMHEVSHA